MNLLHRTAKRFIVTHRVCYPGLVEIPLQAFLHRYRLQDESVQKNIVEESTRHFSAVVDDRIHETSLEDPQRQATVVYRDLLFSQQQHMHTVASEERKGKGDCLDNSTLQPAGRATVLRATTHAGDCLHMIVDDSVTTCISASQKGDETKSNCGAHEAQVVVRVDHKERSCYDEGISDFIVDDTDTISHKSSTNINQIDSTRSEIGEADFLSKCKEENKHFVCRELELAAVDLCKASGKDINKQKDPDSSIQGSVYETALTTGLPNEGKQVHIVDDTASDFLVRDIKSMPQNHIENSANRKMSKVSVDSNETDVQLEDIRMLKVNNFSKVCEKDAKTVSNDKSSEEVRSDFLGFPKRVGDSEMVDSCRKEQVQVSRPHKRADFAISKVTKNKIKKKTNKNAHRQYGPEDLKHLSLTVHDSTPREELEELTDKQKRESKEVFFAVKREVNPGIRHIAAESPLHQNETLGGISQHMKPTEQFNEGDGELSTNSSSMLKPQTCKENEAGDYLFGNEGKMIGYGQLREGTVFDPPSSFWEPGQTIVPEQTIESAVERAKLDFVGVREVHYPLRNQGELYIILDLNGVLIKRWDKNPSIPGVFKLNRKWIQLRPGCIEFLCKAFSSFRVGIWSTMTQTNVLNLCSFLEQQAHERLPFFMLWSKESCYQHGDVRRPNKAKVVADFKPLSRVWGYFEPHLGFHNTILIDDSPYKACMNNPYNCLFPDEFEGREGDTYLNDVLWPYLENMRRSRNLQAYIANNPLGQLPVVVGHELYYHVRKVMDVFDHRSSPLRAA